MRRVLWPVACFVLVLGIVGFLVRDSLRPRVAGLRVESTPEATVIVNGGEVGKTPYRGKMEPGEVEVRLVPVAGDVLLPYETKVSLGQGTEAVVERWFGASEEMSSGQVVSLERYRSEKGEGGVVVVSEPDGAEIRIDGTLKGYSPLVVEGVVAGEHQLAVAAEGYKEKLVNIRVESGYRLTVRMKLAKEEEGVIKREEEKEASAAAEVGGEEELSKPYVVVGETPTGWLRVRSEDGVGGEELGRVDPGEKYPLMAKSEKGWYKIEYKEGEEGWISGEYATVVE